MNGSDGSRVRHLCAQRREEFADGRPERVARDGSPYRAPVRRNIPRGAGAPSTRPRPGAGSSDVLRDWSAASRPRRGRPRFCRGLCDPRDAR